MINKLKRWLRLKLFPVSMQELSQSERGKMRLFEATLFAIAQHNKGSFSFSYDMDTFLAVYDGDISTRLQVRYNTLNRSVELGSEVLSIKGVKPHV